MADRKGSRTNVEQEEFLPFDLPDPVTPEPKVKPLRRPIWTENKAKLIERYLYYFVMITKHGTYIDGFAGPQAPEQYGMWAAKLVLESEPKWFRHFYLFDNNKQQIEHLDELICSQSERDSKGRKVIRDIGIYRGDFNDNIYDLLSSNCIRQKEATFCLLDLFHKSV